MATAVLLFGLNVTPLFDALAWVESNNGLTSTNVYQIAPIFIRDVNQMYFTPRFRCSDVNDRKKSEQMMIAYWKRYAPEYSKRTHKPITYEVLARIHNGGPRGAEKACTDRYWAKVSAVLDEVQKKGIK